MTAELKKAMLGYGRQWWAAHPEATEDELRAELKAVFADNRAAAFLGEFGVARLVRDPFDWLKAIPKVIKGAQSVMRGNYVKGTLEIIDGIVVILSNERSGKTASKSEP